MGEEGSLASAFASPRQSPGRARPSQCSSPVGRQASSSVVHKFYFTYPRSIPIKSPCSTPPVVLMSRQSWGIDTMEDKSRPLLGMRWDSHQGMTQQFISQRFGL